ncbi:ATP-dependent helicase [Metallibacterium scheffleri]|uniref:DNA 3'-5' helicase n=1 Tax=Metallibacterium scheffleri TaxID=993689 RepID=A0A4S3KS61_9GAMM|nr:ATP-dependent helicase [Metallibacterium scheffleri]THD11318.1 hypothetical protein B1806_04145 [Metallibacterium scheffleri]
MALNPGQQRAVDAHGHCLIVACPGSGKTHTLIERAKHILTLSAHAQIGMVTFTRAAAEEMRSRVANSAGSSAAQRVLSGTFHQLALKQFEVYANGKRPFTIATEAHSDVLITKAWEHVVRRFRTRIKRHDLRQQMAYVKANRGHIPPTADGEVVRAALDHYQAQLRAQRMLDFDDIIEYAVQGMQAGALNPLTVTHLLVDEAQDADQMQIDWVLAHADRGILVTCVGDDDQSIYQFRNARGYDGMMHFADYTRAEQITLDTTYRCPSAIVAHASRLIRNNPARIPKRITSASSSRGIVERRDFPNLAAEVADMIRVIQADAAGDQSWAVLARTRGLLRAIETAIYSAGIDYSGGVDGSIWSGGVPGLMRGLMGSVVAGDIVGATMPMAACGMTYEGVNSARTVLHAAGGNLAAITRNKAWVVSLSEHDLDVWQNLQPAYARLLTAVQEEPAAFISAAASIVAMSGDVVADPFLLRTVVEILNGMRGSIRTIYQAIEQAMRQQKDKKQNQSRLALLTLHASKGLEFDNVWMASMREGVLPHTQSPVVEERRLCYVGMTRSKHRLIMSYSASRETRESVFLSEMGLADATVSVAQH